MLRPEQVPEAVVYEVFRRFEMGTKREAAKAIAAAISAWPGMSTRLADTVNVEPRVRQLILPLQEPSDGAA